MKAQHIIHTIPAESFLILAESNWIQMFLRVKGATGGAGEKGVIQSPKTGIPNTSAFTLPRLSRC